jgi:hypothetical protein
MVRRVYHMLVGRPKRVDTARRRRERERAFRVARTRRAKK